MAEKLKTVAERQAEHDAAVAAKADAKEVAAEAKAEAKAVKDNKPKRDKLIREKMAAGLPAGDAAEVADAQIAHDDAVEEAEANKK